MESSKEVSHPLVTKQFRSDVEGTETDFLLALYDDHIMITVSQLDTFGTILQARAEKALEGESTFSVTTLLGRRDEPALTLCARGLASAPILRFKGSHAGSLSPGAQADY
eukprot:scaffold647909_cov47-Prasinocladus_malaysianus.AAC.1